MTAPSIENLKAAAEELKKTGVRDLRRKNLKENPEGPSPFSEKGGAYGAGEKTSATFTLSDLIQEKMKLEKILQEMNNLKSKICQRIELIKTIERREKELNQQLASARKENDFPDQVERRLENLKENIK
jgi:hypothetical protein